MTHLCYTLEEAAERLSLSETVLVRLSQYFKVPRAAYEDVGYLSFKGDLTFSDQDIAFFRQVKERLLAGETLDEVKSRIRDLPVQPASGVTQSPLLSEPSVTYHYQDVAPQPAATPHPLAAETAGPAISPLREVEDRTPYEKAAQRSFERYKSSHRTGLGRVFQNMIKEVGATAGQKKQAAGPALKPLKAKMGEDDPFPQNRTDSVLPFRPIRQSTPPPRRTEPSPPPEPIMSESVPPPPKPAPPASKPYATMPSWQSLGKIGKGSKAKSEKQNQAWSAVIEEAASQPRALNSHLKNAASLLRNRAMQPPAQSDRHPG